MGSDPGWRVKNRLTFNIYYKSVSLSKKERTTLSVIEILERIRSDSTWKERGRASGEQESKIFSPQLYAGRLL